MSKSALFRKRYVNFGRCSTFMQDDSIQNQLQVTNNFAKTHEMIHVRDFDAEGVSASKTFFREDLDSLLEHHREHNDFDVILVHDSSRLTRGGGFHGATIRAAFAERGVLIHSVMDPVPEGDFKVLIQTAIDEINHLYVKHMAFTIARGMRYAVENGTVEKHGQNPFGTDRLYIDAAGTKLYRLKQLPGGRRQLIDERSNTVAVEYGPGEKKMAIHYMAAGERSVLVEGDSAAAEMIRYIFKLRYRDGLGYSRISKLLAEKGYRPRYANHWQQGVVQHICLNPCYIGYSYFGITKGGLHCYTDKGQPKERDVDQAKLRRLGLKTVPKERRPIAEALLVHHPRLIHFITDPIVRENAEPVIREYWRTHHIKKNSPEKGTGFLITNPRPRSRYFLRGLIRSKHTGHLFSPHTSGPSGIYRRYWHAPVNLVAEPTLDTNWALDAGNIESIVLSAIRSVFNDKEYIPRVVAGYAKKIVAEIPTESARKKLAEEDAEIKAHLSFIFRAFGPREQAENEQLIHTLRNRRDEISHQLELLPEDVKPDPDKICSTVLSMIDDLSFQTVDAVAEKLRGLVARIVKSITIDMTDRSGVIELILPRRMLRLTPERLDQVCQSSPEVHSGRRFANSPYDHQHCVYLAKIPLFAVAPDGPHRRYKLWTRNLVWKTGDPVYPDCQTIKPEGDVRDGNPTPSAPLHPAPAPEDLLLSMRPSQDPERRSEYRHQQG